MTEITYAPIGVFNCANTKPYGAPRQAVLAKKSGGSINLNSFVNRDCISDLEGVERIWLIYDFHHNKDWKPKVRPPRGSSTKRSVFATRSPYRPNSIGISCVKLEKIENLKIYISEHDLLDGTPILDIKPYLAYADSFPNAKMGWVSDSDKYEVSFSNKAREKIKWLNDKLGFDIPETVRAQLEFEPTCRKAKRIKKVGTSYLYSLQAWRLPFTVKNKEVIINDLYSGYSKNELNDLHTPQYERYLHREFLNKFARSNL